MTQETQDAKVTKLPNGWVNVEAGNAFSVSISPDKLIHFSRHCTPEQVPDLVAALKSAAVVATTPDDPPADPADPPLWRSRRGQPPPTPASVKPQKVLTSSIGRRGGQRGARAAAQRGSQVAAPRQPRGRR